MKTLFFVSLILVYGYGFCQEDSYNTDTSSISASIHNSGNNWNKQQTLAGHCCHSGGYGALLFKASDFNDASVLMAGIRGVWVVNRAFGIGIEANGIIPINKFDNIAPETGDKAILLGGYGGLFLEPILFSNKVVHLTFPCSGGAGWLGYIEDWEDRYANYDGTLYDEDIFWYLECGASVEVNVASFFRIDVGISKRFSQDLNMMNTSGNSFDKINYLFVLKFGGF